MIFLSWGNYSKLFNLTEYYLYIYIYIYMSSFWSHHFHFSNFFKSESNIFLLSFFFKFWLTLLSTGLHYDANLFIISTIFFYVENIFTCLLIPMRNLFHSLTVMMMMMMMITEKLIGNHDKLMKECIHILNIFT